MRWASVALVLCFAGCNGCRLLPRPFVDSRCRDKPARGCLDDGRSAYTCASGIYGELPCEELETCMDGECVELLCRPSYFWCDGEVADVCDATGTKQMRTDCAREGKSCRVEALAAACVDQACEPNRVHCSPDGREVRKCGDGMSFTVVETCRAETAAACVSGRCVARCDTVEAGARTTLGCKLYGALVSPADKLLVANPNELDVTLSVKGVLPGTFTVAAGAVQDFSFGLTPGTTTHVGKAIIVDAQLPIYAWIANSAGSAYAMLPALSTEHRVAVDGSGGHYLVVIAASDGTDVTATVAAASDGGPMVSPAPQNGSVAFTLLRGEQLTVSSSGNLNGSRVISSAPVVVLAASLGGVVSLPGADRLGRDYLLVDAATVVAQAAATVTTQLDGTLSLAAGQSSRLQAGQRVSATAPLAVAGKTFVPAIAAWQASSFVAHIPGIDGELWVTTESGTTKMPASDGPLALASPFFAQIDSAAGRVPLAFGLAPLP